MIKSENQYFFYSSPEQTEYLRKFERNYSPINASTPSNIEPNSSRSNSANKIEDFNNSSTYNNEFSFLNQSINDLKSNTRGNRFFPENAVDILSKWFIDNQDYPYPDETTTNCLATEANISAKQVRKWFANKRVRSNKIIRQKSKSKRVSKPQLEETKQNENDFEYGQEEHEDQEHNQCKTQNESFDFRLNNPQKIARPGSASSSPSSNSFASSNNSSTSFYSPSTVYNQTMQSVLFSYQNMLRHGQNIQLSQSNPIALLRALSTVYNPYLMSNMFQNNVSNLSNNLDLENSKTSNNNNGKTDSSNKRTKINFGDISNLVN